MTLRNLIFPADPRAGKHQIKFKYKRRSFRLYIEGVLSILIQWRTKILNRSWAWLNWTYWEEIFQMEQSHHQESKCRFTTFSDIKHFTCNIYKWLWKHQFDNLKSLGGGPAITIKAIFNISSHFMRKCS